MINTCYLAHFLAYFATAYLGGSLYYYIVTRSYDTPFKNSLNRAQLEIKQISSRKRANAFFTGCAISIVLLLLIRPYRKCL